MRAILTGHFPPLLFPTWRKIVKRNRQSGFSLPEIAVVILILTCMAVPVFLTAQNNAAASTAKKRVMLISQAEEVSPVERI